MNVLQDIEEAFSKEITMLKSIINWKKELPEQVFSSYKNFAILEFDYIFSKDFFEKISVFLNQIGEEELIFIVIDPNPKSYYFHNFGKYPFFKIHQSCTFEEYISILSKDPGNSPADAILYNSSRLIIHSDSLNWAIYGSRDFEVAIFATELDTIVQLFKQCIENTFDIESAIELVIEPAWGGNLEQEVADVLLANYIGEQMELVSKVVERGK